MREKSNMAAFSEANPLQGAKHFSVCLKDV
jgi:hypothetical protein